MYHFFSYPLSFPWKELIVFDSTVKKVDVFCGPEMIEIIQMVISFRTKKGYNIFCLFFMLPL